MPLFSTLMLIETNVTFWFIAAAILLLGIPILFFIVVAARIVASSFQSYMDAKREVMSKLHMLSQFADIPAVSQDGSPLTIEQLTVKLSEIQIDLRTAASELLAAYEALPLRLFFVSILQIPSRSNMKKAVETIVGVSNSIWHADDATGLLIDTNRARRNRIAHYLHWPKES